MGCLLYGAVEGYKRNKKQELSCDNCIHSMSKGKQGCDLARIKEENKKIAEWEAYLNMTYDEYVSHLLNKYGAITQPYFTDKYCNEYNKSIRMGCFGLYIHHIAEDIVPSLSKKRVASQNLWSYQQGDKLVYCDPLEHLLLHIKIYEKTGNGNLGIKGAVIIAREIGDYYLYGVPTNWKRPYAVKVADKLNEYLDCIEILIQCLREIGYSTKGVYNLIFNSTPDVVNTFVLESFENRNSDAIAYITGVQQDISDDMLYADTVSINKDAYIDAICSVVEIKGFYVDTLNSEIYLLSDFGISYEIDLQELIDTSTIEASYNVITVNNYVVCKTDMYIKPEYVQNVAELANKYFEVLEEK